MRARGVQQPVAQQLGLDQGELAVQEGGLGPGDQVGGGQRQLQPDWAGYLISDSDH